MAPAVRRRLEETEEHPMEMIVGLGLVLVSAILILGIINVVRGNYPSRV